MGLFGSKTKKENVLAAYKNVKMCDLSSILDEDELDMLPTSLWSYGKMKPDAKEICGDLKILVEETKSVPEDKLGVCIAAADTAIRTFGAAGMTSATNKSMLEKLKRYTGR